MHLKCCNMADLMASTSSSRKDDCYKFFLRIIELVVAAEEVICERINIESTNKFKITAW